MQIKQSLIDVLVSEGATPEEIDRMLQPYLTDLGGAQARYIAACSMIEIKERERDEAVADIERIEATLAKFTTDES